MSLAACFVITPPIHAEDTFSQQRFERALPPHPGPLPQGEGIRGVAFQSSQAFSPVAAQEAVLPLPKGEGRGEGGGSVILSIASLATKASNEDSETAEKAAAKSSPFRFAELNDKSLGLWEGERPVLVYNHGVMSQSAVPTKFNRSTYVHPLYGLDGEVLTDDFPKDHFHHRGLFWAWPHVMVDGKNYDLWMINGIHQRFERWLARETGPESAVLGVENGWFIGDKKVVQERVSLRVSSATRDERELDVDLAWIPVDRPLTLQGAEGKSYGGLTLRFAPRDETVITTPQGQSKDDLPMTRLPWADLSARFGGRAQPSGAAIFIAPDHPDYPPEWLTRHYGVLCLGWPGVKAKTFQPGEVIRCRYRVWIHRGSRDEEALRKAYRDYEQSARDHRQTAQRSAVPGTNGLVRFAPAQTLRAELKQDRVGVSVEGKLFTEYLFAGESKYPYFFPVNGPRTGRSITARNIEPYPHHSSLFFGCDKVSGGNYWQEGLERGRIVSKQVRLTRASGVEIAFEQDCRWERPGAEAPFDDHRKVSISAPSPDLRYIDVAITLVARTNVRIEKSNHSLFAARVAPEISVTGGGCLVNANGDRGERGTFGRPSPWSDYRGTRDGVSEGLAILAHAQDRWFPPRWFTRDYGFMSPTPMFWLEGDALTLRDGERLEFRYRVIIHAGDLGVPDLEKAFRLWSEKL
ncbi:MAG: PmoA family protein [Verrucomicrobia bacterium]|nr:PmoA family protein [Verrucomicrobiota bacterium]